MMADNPTPAERLIHDLLAPPTKEIAEDRRRLRDKEDAGSLRAIVARHHKGRIKGLTMDEVRVLVTVAHRLDRQMSN